MTDAKVAGGNDLASLIDQLRVSNRTTVRNPAKGLLVEAGASVVEPLLALLEDRDENLRCDAVEILGEIGDPRAVGPLARSLGDRSKGVRIEARDALLRLAGTRDVTESVIDFVLQLPPTATFDPEIVAYVLSAQEEPRGAVEHLLRIAADEHRQADQAGRQRVLQVAERCMGKDGVAGVLQLLAGQDELDAGLARELWLEMGGFSTAKEREARLERDFTNDTRAVMDQGLRNWKTMSDRANVAFGVMLVMGILVFILGMVISGFAVYFLAASEREDLVTLFGSGVSFVSGLAILLSTFYRGPLDKIRQSVATLGRTHMAFIGFMNRVGQISVTFEGHYIEGKMGISELRETNELLENAMRDSNDILSPTPRPARHQSDEHSPSPTTESVEQ